MPPLHRLPHNNQPQPHSTPPRPTAQLSEIKAAVGGALSRFTQGEMSADQLVAFLSAMGVELRGRCVCVRGLGGLEGWGAGACGD